MRNQEIAEIFSSIADILEIKDENPFRIRAYRKAARNIEDLTEDIEAVARKGKLSGLPGIGKDLAGKIEEYISTNKIKFYENLKKSVSRYVLELMAIPGIGPKTAKLLCDKLKVKGIRDLKRKASRGKIKGIDGIKDKTVTNILKGIDFLKKSEEKTPLDRAEKIADRITGSITNIRGVKKIEVAGSLRRMKESVRDIDILVTSSDPCKVTDAFTGLAASQQVLAHGPTKASVIMREKIQVDIRVVKPSDFGAALLYFTGSKAHNIKLRKMALKKGLKINEYGIFRLATNKKIAGASEENMYKALKMPYIPPELREDKGEIESAIKARLPNLVRAKDIKGDLHVHTKASDGKLSPEEIAALCQKLGYEYVVITDHSASLKIAGGLEEKELMSNVKKIRKLNGKLRKIKLLAGTEVDILGDGQLDYKDSVLKELDFVIAAVHTGFKQSREVITNRVLKAMGNRYVNMIAHPTGRLMDVRGPYEIDLEKVFKAARDTDTTLEINSYPERLDLDDNACRRAKELGVTLGIATDAHTREQFNNMIYGVSTARRGWLRKKDILNCLDLEAFLKRIKK